jgi:hypothetical protein
LQYKPRKQRLPQDKESGWTVEEYYQLPEDENRYELVDGRLDTYHQGNDWREWKDSFVDRLRIILGGFPKRHADLDPEVTEQVLCNGYIRQRVAINAYAELRMSVYVLTPNKALSPVPAVIACHGHGYGSKEIVGLESDGSSRKGDSGLHKDFAVSLVQRGFVVAAPELLGFGDR